MSNTAQKLTADPRNRSKEGHIQVVRLAAAAEKIPGVREGGTRTRPAYFFPDGSSLTICYVSDDYDDEWPKSFVDNYR